MKKTLDYLAYKSYLVIKITFSISLLILVIYYYFVSENIPIWWLFVFFLLSGIFVGYSIAYYSIKHLQATK
jgi:drug/metabolite transporter (DMT)-like permease